MKYELRGFSSHKAIVLRHVLFDKSKHDSSGNTKDMCVRKEMQLDEEQNCLECRKKGARQETVCLTTQRGPSSAPKKTLRKDKATHAPAEISATSLPCQFICH